MQREGRDLLGDLLDLHLESDGVLAEPAQIGIGGRPAIAVLLQPRNCAIVNDLAFFVAPAAVDHLVDGDLVDVTGDDTIHEAGGVAPGDHVLEQRGHVEKRGGVANGVVFMLVMSFINADRIEPRPLTVIQALAKWKGALVDCRSYGHDDSWVRFDVRGL